MKKVNVRSVTIRIIVMVILILGLNVVVQASDYTKYFRDSVWVFDDTIKVMKSDFFYLMQADLGLSDKDDEMIESFSVNKDGSAPMLVGEGHFLTKYDQYYKGYQVLGGEFNLMGQHNVVLRGTGHIVRNLDVDVDIQIAEDDALQIALAVVFASKYAWEDTTAADLPNASPAYYQEPGYWYNSTEEAFYRNSAILRHWFYRFTNKPNIGIETADNSSYNTIFGWANYGETWPTLANKSRMELEYDYGQCSRELIAGVQSWQLVNLLPGITFWHCFIIPSHSNDVVVGPLVGHKPGQKPAIVSPAPNVDSVPSGGYYHYTIPSSWYARQVGDSLIIDSLANNDSKTLYYTYTAPDSTVYTGQKVIHVVDEEAIVPISSRFNFGTKKDEKSEVLVYPNPANNEIEVLLPKKITDGQYSISDIRGVVVAKGSINGSRAKLQLPKVANGIYILQISSKEISTTNKIQISQR